MRADARPGWPGSALLHGTIRGTVCTFPTGGRPQRHFCAVPQRLGGRLLLVSHISRHAAVDDELGAGYETRACAVEEEADGLGDILRPPDPANRMLRVVL